jgi:hypothetical protein
MPALFCRNCGEARPFKCDARGEYCFCITCAHYLGGVLIQKCGLVAWCVRDAFIAHLDGFAKIIRITDFAQ